MGMSAVIKGGQLAVLFVLCCMSASSVLCCNLPVILVLLSRCSHDISLPVLTVCVNFSFLYRFLCVFMLFCRLGRELPKVLWSLAVAAFLACACPFLVAWMSGLSGISMGL